jgi:hypothetical protein
MLNHILQAVFEICGLVVFGLMLIGLPFGWGTTCAAWHRAHGVSRKETSCRAAAVPALVLLGGYFLVPTVGNRVWIFWLLVISTVAALAGVRWECHRYPDPPRLYRWWSEKDFLELPFTGPGVNLPAYECWKCGKSKLGFWLHEVTIQDKYKKNHAFAWMPVCEECVLSASESLYGPS